MGHFAARTDYLHGRHGWLDTTSPVAGYGQLPRNASTATGEAMRRTARGTLRHRLELAAATESQTTSSRRRPICILPRRRYVQLARQAARHGARAAAAHGAAGFTYGDGAHDLRAVGVGLTPA